MIVLEFILAELVSLLFSSDITDDPSLAQTSWTSPRQRVLLRPFRDDPLLYHRSSVFPRILSSKLLPRRFVRFFFLIYRPSFRRPKLTRLSSSSPSPDSSDPTNLTADSVISLGTACGGWYDPSIDANRGYFSIDSLDGSQLGDPKGFICPGPNQMCLQGDSNLQTGQSFDNILAAAQQVIIIASGEFDSG